MMIDGDADRMDKAPCLRGRLLSMLRYFGSQIFLFRTLKAFSHVRRSVKQALYDIYRRDFELFGYNAEQYFLWHVHRHWKSMKNPLVILKKYFFHSVLQITQPKSQLIPLLSKSFSDFEEILFSAPSANHSTQKSSHPSPGTSLGNFGKRNLASWKLNFEIHNFERTHKDHLIKNFCRISIWNFQSKLFWYFVRALNCGGEEGCWWDAMLRRYEFTLIRVSSQKHLFLKVQYEGKWQTLH